MSQTKGMQAISIWEHYADLIMNGEKGFLSRKFYTHQRGRIAIHSAASKPERLNRDIPGYIVGTVDLRACMKVETLCTWLSEERQKAEFAMGKFRPGEFAWQVANPIKFAKPIPCIGQPGFFEWAENLPDASDMFHFSCDATDLMDLFGIVSSSTIPTARRQRLLRVLGNNTV